MRIGGPTLPPTPVVDERSPGAELFDAISDELRVASIATKFSAMTALEHGDFARAPADVRGLFERVALLVGVDNP